MIDTDGVRESTKTGGAGELAGQDGGLASHLRRESYPRLRQGQEEIHILPIRNVGIFSSHFPLMSYTPS
jgi:hypothetical protein